MLKTLLRPPTLCAVVRRATGQDLRRCALCLQCSADLDPEMDVTLRRLMSLILADDDNALESRTLWSSRLLSRAAHACPFGLNLEETLLALREEAWRRGVVETII